MCKCLRNFDPCTRELRHRIARANDAIPEESWTADELCVLAAFLESVAASRAAGDASDGVADARVINFARR